MKLWKRILSCFLALLLTVYLLPVQVMAEELGDLWPLTTENIAETPPDVIGEVLERRGENQKEFLLANGRAAGSYLSCSRSLSKRWPVGGYR